MAVIENQYPYKIYEAANAGSADAHVFLGKASIGGLNGSAEDFFPHLAEGNCFTTFVFASIVGGKNVRIIPATEDDPYIYIDSRWYDFAPCGNPVTSIFHSVEYNNGDVNVFLKSVTSDGSVVIEVGDSFTWSDQGPQGIWDGDCTITLSTHRYYCENECRDEGAGVFYRTEGVPGASDVNFLFKSIVGGTCINVEDTGTEIVVNFDIDGCDPCELFNCP